MFRILRIFWKLLAVLFLVLSITVAATGIYCYCYRDQIIQKFLKEANQRLENSVRVGSIQLTALDTFPNIGIVLQEVVIKDCTNPAKEFISAHKIYCSLNLWKLIHGQYLVNRLALTQGKLLLEEESMHQLAWKMNEQAATQQDSIKTVGLDQLELKDIEIVYKTKQYHCTVNVAQIHAHLRQVETGLEVDLQGRAIFQNVQVKELELDFAQHLPITLKAALHYQKKTQTWSLEATQLKHGKSLLALQGSWGNTSPTSLVIRGTAISPQLLSHCLPKQYCQLIHFNNLRGQLNVDFNIHQQVGKALALQGNFALCDGTLMVNQLSEPIVLNKLSGSLHIPDMQDFKNATLSVDKIVSTLAGSTLNGHLKLIDFYDLHVQCAAEASVDLASLSNSLAHFPVKNASGKLDMCGEFATHLPPTKLDWGAKDNFQFSGTLQAQDIQFQLGQDPLLCKEVRGNLMFQNNEVIVKNCSGSIGPGSFTVNGKIQNLLPYLLSDHQQLCASAQLYMDSLDLNTLFAKYHVGDRASLITDINVAPQWVLDLACDIQQFNFRQFQGKNVQTKLKLKDKKLIVEKLQLGISGGKAFVEGVIDTTPHFFNMHTKAKLREVQIAKLFYMFENFQQQFLMDKHLDGEIFADVDLTMQIDKQGNLCWDTLRADIDARINSGALYQFGPIQLLNKYIPQGNFDQLRFSELKNRVSIKDQTIYIPPMEIYSNVTCIQLSGKHTFDGKIDYNLVVPFTNYQRQEGEAIAADALAGINLFFKLQGDVNHYEIKYDTEALRNSLRGKFQKEGKIIKDLLQGKYLRKAQPQELKLDDYFEFE